MAYDRVSRELASGFPLGTYLFQRFLRAGMCVECAETQTEPLLSEAFGALIGSRAPEIFATQVCSSAAANRVERAGDSLMITSA